jgi:hypothetical protein
MSGLLKLILSVLASFFRLRARLEAENLVLRQQINVLRRRTPKRPHLNNTDRLCLFGSIAGFPQFLKRWRLSGRRQLFGGTALGFGRTGVGGHAIVLADLSADLRKLIGEMSHANPLWARHTFMANCSSLASKSLSRRSLGICAAARGPRRRAGERFRLSSEPWQFFRTSSRATPWLSASRIRRPSYPTRRLLNRPRCFV